MSTRGLLRRHVLGGALLGVSVGAVVGAMLLLPDRVGLDRHAPFAQLTAFRPQLLVGGAGLAALLAATAGGVVGHRVLHGRRRRGAIVGPVAPSHVFGAAAGLLAVAVLSGAPLPARLGADAPPPAGRQLTVLSLNTFAGKADPGAVAAAIAANRPDVVVLIEAADRYLAALTDRTGTAAYRSWVVGSGGSAAEDWGTVLLAAPRVGDLRVREVDLGTRYRWLEATGGELGSTRLLAAHVASPVREWIARWPGELALVGRWCSDGGPSVVVGDLNATPDHSAFREGTAGCADSSATTGRGLEGTWPAWAPAVLRAPIDHVLLAGGPRASSVERLVVPGSDHLASVTRLVLPDG